MKSFFLLWLFVPLFCWGQFKIEGTLKDKNNDPIPSCAVKLSQNGKVVKASLSKDSGAFELIHIPRGSYILEINAAFYEPLTQELSVQDNISLGAIVLSPQVQSLEGVKITYTKKPVSPTTTGVLIEVASSRLSNRESLLEILNYAPTVSTANGISILGDDNIQIVLNGKKLHLSKEKITAFLERLPVPLIDNIEVVDRVDASVEGSQSGIIKINTIIEDGWAGYLNHVSSYRARLGYKDDASLYYGTDKYRLFTNLYHERNKTSSEEKENMTLKSEDISYNSTSQGNVKRLQNSLDLGFDYNLTPSSTLSLLYTFEYDKDKDHLIDTRTDILRGNRFDHLLTSQKRINQTSLNHTLSVAFEHTLDTLDSNVTLSFDFMRKRYDAPLFLEETHHTRPQTIKAQDQENSSGSYVYALEGAWQKNFPSEQELSLGTRLSLVDNWDLFSLYDYLNEQRQHTPSFTSDFFLKEYLWALYANYTFPIGEHASLSAGVRSEYNYNDFNNRTETFDNNSRQALFNVQYNTLLGNKNFYLSASQRLDKPYFYAFNPTYVRTDLTNAYMGNKDLKPANIYQLQAGYNGVVNLNLRYRYTENNILYLPSDINGIRTSRPENGGYKNDVFLFVSTLQNLTPWWEANLKLTGALSHYNFPKEKLHSLFGDVSLDQHFYLPWNLELGISYSYTSAHKHLYYNNKDTHSLDANLFYPITKSLRVNFFVNDIFNTSRTQYEYDYNNVHTYYRNKDLTRAFFLSLTYHFLKGKKVDEDIRESNVGEEKGRLR